MPETTCECEKCDMCHKNGLPILLTRYSVAPKTAGIPFKIGLPISLGDDAIYTQRLLRSGYVYIYDEARKLWQGYFVTPHAHFAPFEVSETAYAMGAQRGLSPGHQPAPEKIAPCKPEKNGEISGLITIRGAQETGMIALCFSDVEWTQAVWERHQDAATAPAICSALTSKNGSLLVNTSTP